jgi:hypothetical protein
MSEDERMATFDAVAFALVAMNRAGAPGGDAKNNRAQRPLTAPRVFN